MSIDIICTIGPASSSPEILRDMLLEGMTIARLNMSHGTHESHGKAITLLKEVSRGVGKTIRIMGDLQGPKIRLGDIKGESALLAEGQRFELMTSPVEGDAKRAYIDYPTIIKDLKPGGTILINDGEIKLKVTEITEDRIQTKVIVGGEIRSNKGVNFPGASLSIPAITEKDKEDLSFLLREGADMIACSFIRQSAHLEEIRVVCRSFGGPIPGLIAKIETMEGVKNFQSIAAQADGIMIARGDLGVELPYEQIPYIQKVLLQECRLSGLYVITATQMLQSMIEKPVPTRAEVTDIFQAVLDGSKAVMLSGESSVGKYPVESVKVLRSVSHYAEEIGSEVRFTLDELLVQSPFH